MYRNIDKKTFTKVMKNITKHSPNGKGLMKFVIASEIMTENTEFFDDDLFNELIKRLDSDPRAM